MPCERSAASIGILGNSDFRVVVTTPLPAPLSRAVAEGAEKGEISCTQDIKASAGGRVTCSALAAYTDEAVPQSSDDGKSGMDGQLCIAGCSVRIVRRGVNGVEGIGSVSGKRMKLTLMLCV